MRTTAETVSCLTACCPLLTVCLLLGELGLAVTAATSGLLTIVRPVYITTILRSFIHTYRGVRRGRKLSFEERKSRVELRDKLLGGANDCHLCAVAGLGPDPIGAPERGNCCDQRNTFGCVTPGYEGQ